MSLLLVIGRSSVAFIRSSCSDTGQTSEIAALPSVARNDESWLEIAEALQGFVVLLPVISDLDPEAEEDLRAQ